MNEINNIVSDCYAKSIFVYEYLSGGGLCNENVPMSLLSEGFSMLSSLIGDFSALGFKIHLLLDYRLKDRLNKLKEKSSKIKYDFINESNELRSRFDEYIIISDYILIIAPESNYILFKLVSRAEEILKSFENKHLLNVSSALTFIGSNKLITEEKLRDLLNLDFPSSFTISDFFDFYIKTVECPERIISPTKITQFIVKPADGVGCVDTFQITYDSNYFSLYPDKILEDLKRVFDYIKNYQPHTDFIVQNKIEGIPLSISAINRNGTLSFFSINKQNLVTEVVAFENPLNKCILEKLNYIGGTSPYNKMPEELILYINTMIKNLCQHYIFTGFFGIDFIFNSHYDFLDNPKKALTLIELNPRITTPYIAYSQLFKQDSKNIAELFFKGDFNYQNQKLLFHCEYSKDEQNDEMKIILKR